MAIAISDQNVHSYRTDTSDSGPILPVVRSQSGCDRARQTEIRAFELLERHPQFRGRSHWIDCRQSGNHLCLSGRLPSYYLKQLAQEILRVLDDVDRIENRIIVASPCGRVLPSIEPPVCRCSEIHKPR